MNAAADTRPPAAAARRDWMEVIGRRQTGALVVQIFRYRFLLAPLLTVFIAVFFIWDPVPWKLAWIGITLSALLGLSAVEYWLARRRRATLRRLRVNLALLTVIQAAMIYITGGIASPLLPIFIPLCLAAGLLAPRWSSGLWVLLVPLGATLLLAAGCLYGLLPRTAPAFFELGAGWVDKPVYVWTTAGVIVFLALASYSVAHAIRSAIGGQVVRVVEARQQAVESLAGRNRELLGVSRTIAHELKNPLASIQGLAQLMARAAEPDSKQAERLQVMVAEIGRMGEVLEGFRSFTRPLTDLQLERVELGAVVAEVVALHEGLAAERGQQLSLVAAPLRLRCDAQKVKQALINLLQNAIEAAPAGGQIQVRLGPWHDGGRVEVQDDGPGLSEQSRAHLFEAGFSTKDEGSGIGLVVARSIARQHGGELAVEDGLAGGALASLYLPAEPEAATAGRQEARA
jgi:signal transduction histidine kinase